MFRTFFIDDEHDQERVDLYLVKELTDTSRSHIQKLIKEGRICVDGKLVHNNYRLKRGESILCEFSDPEEPDIIAEDIPLDIIYEDNDVILINKPKGMVVHPAAGHYTGTLVNALMFHCKGCLSGINGIIRPGIVHRIDKNTTGVLIVCKNDKAHHDIAAQLKKHTITRRYRAIVEGVIKEDEGVIDASIGRHPSDRKKMAVETHRSKKAVTHYRVIERFKNCTYIECILETGRTHQIRVHMSSIHHPLLGDSVYGAHDKIKGLEGQTLHAMVLGFVHPSTKEYMEFSAPLPDYFTNLLETLEK